MKEEDDVFKKFHDSFGQFDGHLYILEHQVPVKRQIEYFEYSQKIRKDPHTPELSDEDCPVYEKSLYDPGSSKEHKEYVLAMLASSRLVKAYRILEEYAQTPDPEVADWAYVAVMESRLLLESELSDEKQIYISTGLGGKGQKLRFYVLVLSTGLKPFQKYQREVVEREFPYSLGEADCEIERLAIKENYVELVFLVPVRSYIRQTLDKVIDECNQYGNFLLPNYVITNVKELSAEEVENVLRRNAEDSQASH